MKTKSLQGAFLTGDALMEYWVKGRAQHEKLLADIGDQ